MIAWGKRETDQAAGRANQAFEVAWFVELPLVDAPLGSFVGIEGTGDMKLWFVDDKRCNHETWANSFSYAIKACCELRCFCSVAELLEEFASGNLPDILFLDFFIGESLGTEVIRWFDGRAFRPVLIAHSSMEQANAGMVREGADFCLGKVKNRPYTESVRAVFRTIEDVMGILENRALRMPADQGAPP